MSTYAYTNPTQVQRPEAKQQKVKTQDNDNKEQAVVTGEFCFQRSFVMNILKLSI